MVLSRDTLTVDGPRDPDRVPLVQHLCQSRAYTSLPFLIVTMGLAPLADARLYSKGEFLCVVYIVPEYFQRICREV